MGYLILIVIKALQNLTGSPAGFESLNRIDSEHGYRLLLFSHPCDQATPVHSDIINALHQGIKQESTRYDVAASDSEMFYPLRSIIYVSAC